MKAMIINFSGNVGKSKKAGNQGAKQALFRRPAAGFADWLRWCW